MSFEDDLENQCQARLLNEYYRQEFKEYIDNDDKYKSIEKLACINDKADYPFENIRGAMYRHCHPVLKDEVTFYEDKNNE